jgi:hypothetical protein
MIEVCRISPVAAAGGMIWSGCHDCGHAAALHSTGGGPCSLCAITDAADQISQAAQKTFASIRVGKIVTPADDAVRELTWSFGWHALQLAVNPGGLIRETALAQRVPQEIIAHPYRVEAGALSIVFTWRWTADGGPVRESPLTRGDLETIVAGQRRELEALKAKRDALVDCVAMYDTGQFKDKLQTFDAMRILVEQ